MSWVTQLGFLQLATARKSNNGLKMLHEQESLLGGVQQAFKGNVNVDKFSKIEGDLQKRKVFDLAYSTQEDTLKKSIAEDIKKNTGFTT